MSNQKNDVSKEAVETVDKILDHCISTIAFWNLSNVWPTNLIYDSLLTAQKTLKFIKTGGKNEVDIYLESRGKKG